MKFSKENIKSSHCKAKQSKAKQSNTIELNSSYAIASCTIQFNVMEQEC